MSKRLVRLVLFVAVAAAILPFVGCPSDGGGAGGDSYIGDWEYIDISEGDPGILDDGDGRQLFNITADDWTMMIYERSGALWVPQVGMQGTYTATADTWTVTLEGLSLPPAYGATWYNQAQWQSEYNYPFLYYAYYTYFYYLAGGNIMDIDYALSADGDTLYMTVGGGTTPFTRI